MIIGEHVYLRPIIRDDIVYLNRWKNDEETFKYLGGGFSPVSIDQQKNWMDSMMDTTGVNRRFIICQKDDKPIGMVGLYEINWVARNCELGIFVGDQNARGKGYGKETSLLIERYAKEYLNMRKIKLNVVADNEHAMNMWRSIGYKNVGILMEERFIKGEYMDLVIMEKFL